MRPWLLVLALLPACNQTERDCEHARELMIGVWQDASKGAIATAPREQRAKLRADSDAEIERARGRFVELCVALPEIGRMCIAQMDKMVAAQREVQQAMKLCKPDEFGMPDPACIEAAQAKGKAALMGCDNLDAFHAQLFAP